jgi:hypothetical protein
VAQHDQSNPVSADSELKRPLQVIAACMAIFVVGCVAVVLLVTIFAIRGTDKSEAIRMEHLQQHTDDHEKYDRMIELLENLTAD